MSNNIYNDLVEILPKEVQIKYSEIIQKPDSITFVDLINILKDFNKHSKDKVINYSILNNIIQQRNIDSFNELEELFETTNVLSEMNLEQRFTVFNTIACSETKSAISFYNLLFMYKRLQEITNENELNENELNDYLKNTNYFNKIIFLKFLLFFQKLNTYLNYKNKRIDRKQLESKIENIKQQLRTYSLQEDTSFLETLFNKENVQDIYNIVISSIENMDNPIIQEIPQYKNLFNYNTYNKLQSSKKASFFVGFHGTLMLINEENKPYKYLTMRTPKNIISNLYRWGERGEATIMFQTMKYSWKQYLISKAGPITKDTMKKLFNITLAGDKKEYNFDETQEIEQKDINNPNIIRIKHYSVDSYNYMLFNSEHKMPDELRTNLQQKIWGQNNKKYSDEDKNEENYINPSNMLHWLSEPFKTAERIIELNCLLLNNNIEFSVFDASSVDFNKIGKNWVGKNWIGLYLDNLNPEKPELQSYLRDYHFPLDLFSNPKFYIQDFVLERDIYALEDMNINIKIKGKDVKFRLEKGDSFVCNPYIIEYFIDKFDSIITIRPGYIINNVKNEILIENCDILNGSNFGKTVTCPSKGLSCYKVTLATLTNYEILKFCSDAGIQTCDIYDTSCQSFEYITRYGGTYFERDNPNDKFTAKRMKTQDETTVLDKEYSPRINKLLVDFDDKIKDRRFSHILLAFENPPVNVPENVPVNVPENVPENPPENVPINPPENEPLIEVTTEPKETPANKAVIPESCIENPEEQTKLPFSEPMSATCNNLTSMPCNPTSKIPCNTIYDNLLSLCNTYYSNYGQIIKQLIVPRVNIKQSRENVKRKRDPEDTSDTELDEPKRGGNNTRKYNIRIKKCKTKTRKCKTKTRKCKTKTKKCKTRKNKK